MIIVKIQGGLGNQLFQYALGRALAERNGVEFKLDISWYGTQTYRKYELNQFNIKENIASDVEVRRFLKYRKKGRKILFLYNWLIADEKKYIREKPYHFNPALLQLIDDVYLDGVWPIEKYFADISDILRKEFTLKKPLPELVRPIVQAMKNTESVSICIRRGDFVTVSKVNDVHGLLPMDYFRDAIKVTTSRIKQPHFFVFSDDIKWVKENFRLDYPATYVSDGHKQIDSYAEFILMSLCKHTINANSSFSWWAGWLNANPNKIVIFPQKWFKDESRNSPDLVPASWTTIPNTHI